MAPRANGVGGYGPDGPGPGREPGPGFGRGEPDGEIEAGFAQARRGGFRDTGPEVLRLQQAALSRAVADGGLTFEGRAYPVSLRPAVLPLSRAQEIRAVAEALVSALDTVARLYCERAEVRALFPAYATVAGPAAALPPLVPLVRVCRLDGVIDEQGRYRVIETNTACPGGVIQSGIAARLWARADQPFSPGLRIEDGFQPLVRAPDAFVDTLIASHVAAHGREPAYAAVVNLHGRYTNEVHWMVEGLAKRGVDAQLLDAAALRPTPTGLADPAGRPVDLVYNKLDPLELIGDASMAGYLRGAARRATTFLNPLMAQWVLEDKAVLAVLTDPRFADDFTARQRALFATHVLWTRFLRAGPTTGPDCEPVDLAAFTAARRAELVLKPTNASRGDGVLVGRFADAGQWERLLASALADGGYVVQEYVRPPRITVIRPTDGAPADMVTGLDSYVFGGRFAGFHARASADPVMNMGRSGVLLPVIVATD